MTIFLFFAGCLSLPILFFIESSIWYTRSSAESGRQAWVIAKTNIILYFSRFMFLIYVSIVYLFIDSGVDEKKVYSLIIFSLGLSIFSHLLIFPRFGQRLGILLAKISGMTTKKLIVNNVIHYNIIFYTSFAVFAICLGIIAPVLLAYLFPDYRLALSVSSQVMNAIGAFILLAFLDPKLSILMDQDKLHSALLSYLYGRVIGFLLALSVITIIFFLR
jgi:hypothetical protein